MLDKNPKQNDVCLQLNSIIQADVLNSVMCSDSFIKSAFLIKLVEKSNIPIVYLDFDLIYSGYVKSKIILPSEKLGLFNPIEENWGCVLREVISFVTNKESLLIIDSLNGFFSMLYNDKDVGITINSYIMLLLYVAKISSSRIVITSIVNQREDKLVLSPLGKHIPELKNMLRIFVGKKDSCIMLDVDSRKEKPHSFEIPIDFELR